MDGMNKILSKIPAIIIIVGFIALGILFGVGLHSQHGITNENIYKIVRLSSELGYRYAEMGYSIEEMHQGVEEVIKESSNPFVEDKKNMEEHIIQDWNWCKSLKMLTRV